MWFHFLHSVEQLSKLSTYGGNDSIVAFARNHGVNIVIHQLNEPAGLFMVEITAKMDTLESYIYLTTMVNITRLYDALMTTLQNQPGLSIMKKHLLLQL